MKEKAEQKAWNWDYTRWVIAIWGTMIVLIGLFSWFMGNQDGHLTIPCIILWVFGVPILLCSLLIEKWRK